MVDISFLKALYKLRVWQVNATGEDKLCEQAMVAFELALLLDCLVELLISTVRLHKVACDRVEELIFFILPHLTSLLSKVIFQQLRVILD